MQDNGDVRFWYMAATFLAIRECFESGLVAGKQFSGLLQQTPG